MERWREYITVPTPDETATEVDWISQKLEVIGEEKLSSMIDVAVRIREYAYNPYSEFSVGASVLTESGAIYASPNTEVVSYSETGHAEGNAISKAISEGEVSDGREFIEAVVVCAPGSAMPCGRCRQCIIEHAIDGNALIVTVNPEAEVTAVTSLKTIFPQAFTPGDLGIN